MTAVMSPPPRQLPMSALPSSEDPTPRQIIASARANPAPARGVLGLGALSSLMLWCTFTPVDFSPLGWIALVPLLILVRLERPAAWMYSLLYLAGAGFWFPTLQWMRLGDRTMYVAWSALALYLAAYFPLFVGLTRVLVRRFQLPLVCAAPVVWVGMEYLRAYLFTGFSWYYLGHSQYRWLEMIQISDLVGAYGVSFVMVSVSAALSLLIPQRWLQFCSLFPPADSSGERSPAPLQSTQWRQVGIALLLFLAAWGYGTWRRVGNTFTVGPRVAAIQGNFPTSVQENHDPVAVYKQHMKLTGEALLQQPDLIVWPEVSFRWPYMATPKDLSKEELKERFGEFALRWNDETVPRELASMSQKAQAALVIGVETRTADRQGLQVYNSALFVTPQRGVASRYDKQHRVPFGEYLPLYETLPFLSYFSPYRGQMGINAGVAPTIMEHKEIRYTPVICFEDTIPHLVRDAIRQGQLADPRGRKPDVMLNLTNDGWFHGSSELDQHLITAAFRAVECRTPLVRAVNTGISALIDGDGAIRTRAKQAETGRSKQVEAFFVESIPLDRRTSLYVTYGDWPAALCLLVSGLAACWGVSARIRQWRAPKSAPLSEKLRQKLA